MDGKPTPSRQPAPPLGWVRSPLWDAFWLQSGLWLAPLALVLSSFAGTQPSGLAHNVYLVFSALFWIGHRFSSSWAAWLSTAYREARQVSPIRFWAVPIVVISFTATMVWAPDNTLPGTWQQRVFVLTVIDYFLVTYHFAAQHFGVLSLYRTLEGGARDTRTRDRVFALIVGGFLIGLGDVLRGATGIPDAWLASIFPLMSWMSSLFTAPHVAVIILVVFTLWVGWHESQHGKFWGRRLYALGMLVMAFTAVFADPFIFIFCWTTQHWLTAVGLTSQVIESEPAPNPPAFTTTMLHRIHQAPGRWIALMCVLSTLAMPFYEVEASTGPDDRPTFQVLDSALNSSLSHPEMIRTFVFLGLSTAFLHYVLDRAIWRFSDSAVRRATLPLFRNRA